MSLTHTKAQHHAMRSLVIIVTLISATALLGGCGKSGVDRIQVNGKVTFNGAAPSANGTLTFTSVKPAEGYPARPGRAKFTQGDGTFTATTVNPGDGLVPGTYGVNITCWSRRPTEETPGISYVPKNYTPPELVIEPDQSGPIEYNLEIPSS